MKKILLLSAIMAGAMSVNAQSDFKVKEIAKLPVKNITNYDKTVMRSGYGFGDKVYMTDRGAQQLRVFDLGTGEEVASIVEVHLIDVIIGVGYARLERATVLEHGLGFRLPSHVEELQHTLRVVDNQCLAIVAYSKASATSSIEQIDVVAFATVEGNFAFACNINE